MEGIAISKFKATCLAVPKNVRKTGMARLGSTAPMKLLLPPRSRRPVSGGHGAGVSADSGHCR